MLSFQSTWPLLAQQTTDAGQAGYDMQQNVASVYTKGYKTVCDLEVH